MEKGCRNRCYGFNLGLLSLLTLIIREECLIKKVNISYRIQERLSQMIYFNKELNIFSPLITIPIFTSDNYDIYIYIYINKYSGKIMSDYKVLKFLRTN